MISNDMTPRSNLLVVGVGQRNAVRSSLQTLHLSVLIIHPFLPHFGKTAIPFSGGVSHFTAVRSSSHISIRVFAYQPVNRESSFIGSLLSPSYSTALLIEMWQRQLFNTSFF